MVITRSLSHLGLNRYRVVTDGQTDRRTERIAIANTRSAVPAGTAVARKRSRYAATSIEKKMSSVAFKMYKNDVPLSKFNRHADIIPQSRSSCAMCFDWLNDTEQNILFLHKYSHVVKWGWNDYHWSNLVHVSLSSFQQVSVELSRMLSLTSCTI